MQETLDACYGSPYIPNPTEGLVANGEVQTLRRTGYVPAPPMRTTSSTTSVSGSWCAMKIMPILPRN